MSWWLVGNERPGFRETKNGKGKKKVRRVGGMISDTKAPVVRKPKSKQ